MADGTTHTIMTGVGLIMAVCQAFILMWTHTGGIITETAAGMGTGGTMNGFRLRAFSRTGEPGKIIDTGRGKDVGVSMITSRYQDLRIGK